MIISISGFPGAGKSTVAEALARDLNMERFYMGQILRDKAKSMSITIEQLLGLANNDGGIIDREVDHYVEELGRTRDNFIIESRTAWHLIPQSIKIYVDVSLDEAAKRIWKDRQFNRDRNELAAKDIEELKSQILDRVQLEKERYAKYYGIDSFDKSNFDFVINTDQIPPEEVTKRIIEFLKSVGCPCPATTN